MTLTRPVRITLGALAFLALGALGAYLFIRARGNRLLQGAGEAWIAHRVATLSDSVYQVRLHRLRYQPATRSLRFDSLVVGTDVVRNQARHHPLPTLTLSVHNGRVTGIDAWDIVSGRRIRAKEVGFDSVRTVVVLPPIFHDSAAAPKPAPADTGPKPTMIVIGEADSAVLGSALALVERVRFDNMGGRLVLPFADGPQELELAGLSVDLEHVTFDPRREATSPFHVADVRVQARRFVGDLGKTDRLALAGLSGSFKDSTFQLDSVRLAPRGGDAGYMKGRKYRGTRAQVGADRLAVEGLDWDGLLQGTRVAARRLVVDGLELDLMLDKRLPANPGPKKPRPYPQQRVAALRGLIEVDSVILHKSRVQYAERSPTGDRPGRLRFEDIEGAITNFTNDPARQTDSTPLRLEATAKLMGAGRLEALIEFPLLSPHFDARYRARLGRMDATHLNEILGPLVGAEIKEGEFTSLVLDARVRNGVYSGILIPQYRNLGVTIPQTAKQKKEEHGVKGFFKGIKRGAMNVAANTVVRTNNPAKPDKPPETGTVAHVRRPWESFWAGIWQSLKPALKESLVNVDL
ncbi:MAG TPA: DUF748 domain-containing protein [Gemmatimonadales bacterium]|nr:DUF748 domain-containing protein [Gemmatimonadales bacterium]